MNLADVVVPDSAAATLALEVVTEYSAPALVNHCRRSYVLAASLAAIEGFPVDHEALWVAAMLHDIGLEDPFDSHRLPFEQAGGHVGWVFAAGAGWDASRRRKVSDAIVHHMVGTDVATDPEGYALDVATGLDISGRRIELWPRDLVVELVATYPRLDLVERFTACFRDQAERKPSSTAGQMASLLPQRLAESPLNAL